MKIEIKSPTEIVLTPEDELEHAIIDGHEWRVEKREPKPMDVYVAALALVAQQENVE